MKKKIAIAVIVIGFISGIMFFSAGMKIKKSGKELTVLRSVGGTTVSEAYYQEIGRYGIAYSYLYYAFGFGIISISLGLGGILLSDRKGE